MAKIAIVFVVSMVVLVSIQSVFADEDSSSGKVLNQLDLNKASSKLREAMGGKANPDEELAKENKGESTSWTDWFKTKLENFGINSGSSSPAAASSPFQAPAQAPAA